MSEPNPEVIREAARMVIGEYHGQVVVIVAEDPVSGHYITHHHGEPSAEGRAEIVAEACKLMFEGKLSGMSRTMETYREVEELRRKAERILELVEAIDLVELGIITENLRMVGWIDNRKQIVKAMETFAAIRLNCPRKAEVKS